MGQLFWSSLIDCTELNELNTKAASNGNPATKTTSLSQDSSVSNGEIHHSENQEIPFSKNTILKNIFVGCFSFLFLFTAYDGILNLQTSLNREEGIGSISLSIVFVSVMLSSFLPKFLIARLGCKMSLALSMIGYILYIIANFYAVQATMFPTAILNGLADAPLWTSMFTYLTQSGVWYAKWTNQEKAVVINRFVCLLWLFNQSCQIWGNLVISLVFKPTPTLDDELSLENPNNCGAQFCEGNVSSNFKQDNEKVYTVIGIYVGCSILALLIVAILMDPITLDNEDTEENKKLNPKLLLATVRHLYKSPLQMMLVAITIYGGVEKAFLAGEFTKAYISCSLGIWNLGYVMICYGVVGTLSSLVFGNLVKYVGRIPFFVLLFVVHGGLLIVLLLWVPKRDEVVLFYVFSGLWGVGTMVISTQLYALYGEFFTENSEVAFSNFKLFESTGYAISYSYSTALCIDMKLYICMALLCLGMLGYASAEVTYRAKKKEKTDLPINMPELLVNNKD